MAFARLNVTTDGIMMKPFGLDPRKVPAFGIADLQRGTNLLDDVRMPDYGQSAMFGGGGGGDKQKGGMGPMGAMQKPNGNGVVTPRYAFEQSGAAWWTPEKEGEMKERESALNEFVEAFFEKNLTQAHESMTLNPKYRCVDGVGMVCETVWKNFERDTALDDDDVAAVLLELYEPSRTAHQTHRMALDSLAHNLGQELAEAGDGRGSVRVVRMDATANYVPTERYALQKSTEYYLMTRGDSNGELKTDRVALKASPKVVDVPMRLLDALTSPKYGVVINVNNTRTA